MKRNTIKRSIAGVCLLFTFLLMSMAVHAQKQQEEKNKQVVLTMNALFNSGKVGEAMQYYSHSLVKTGNLNGRSFFVAMQEDIQTTFPDVQTTITDIWADGDWVITFCQFSGTHKGVARLPHHGGLLIGKEPANKHFSVQHIRMYKLQNGKIVERRAVRDDIGMYQQLGILPAAPAFNPASQNK